jgi:hypothetical protein
MIDSINEACQARNLPLLAVSVDDQEYSQFIKTKHFVIEIQECVDGFYANVDCIGAPNRRRRFFNKHQDFAQQAAIAYAIGYYTECFILDPPPPEEATERLL